MHIRARNAMVNIGVKDVEGVCNLDDAPKTIPF